MTTLMMKFGGTTLGTPSAMMRVLHIIKTEFSKWDQLILVISALEGVTDMLFEVARFAQVDNPRGYRRIVANLRTRHLAAIEQLPLSDLEREAVQADIDRLLFDLLDECQAVAQNGYDELTAEVCDGIVGVGEQLSVRIIAALLREHDMRAIALDGYEFMVTDGHFGIATPNMDATNHALQESVVPVLQAGIIPVITGYIGRTEKGQPTTLGRGGSEYSAALLSVALDVDEMWIWSNVDGMLSCDPQYSDNPRVIPHLSYSEVAELAYFGAHILHAKMVSPLEQKFIPLHIKGVDSKNESGTQIHNYAEPMKPHLKAVTSIAGIGIQGYQSGSPIQIIDTVRRTLSLYIKDHDVMVATQSSNASFVYFVFPPTTGIDNLKQICEKVSSALAKSHPGERWTVFEISVITLIGDNIHLIPKQIASVLSAMSEVPIFAMSQGASLSSFSMVIDPKNTLKAVQAAHDIVINTDLNSVPIPSS